MSVFLLCVRYHYVIFFFLVFKVKTHLVRSLKHPGPAAPPRGDRRGVRPGPATHPGSPGPGPTSFLRVTICLAKPRHTVPLQTVRGPRDCGRSAVAL